MKRKIKEIALITLVAIAAILILRSRGTLPWQGSVRFRLNPNSLYDPAFTETQIKTMYLVLSEPGNLNDLALAARANPADFRLASIGVMRGSSLLYISYDGSDSNVVASIAAKASEIMATTYATNQPPIEMQITDPPEARLKRMLSERLLNR